mgnify:CR=1 FL=1
MQVQDLPPVCLLEWVGERAGERTVRDVIPATAWSRAAVILANGFLLPVLQARLIERPGEPLTLTLEEVAGWYVADILSMPGTDAVAVELLPQGAVVDKQPGIFIQLHLDTLLYLLFDEQIRKVEL